MPDALRGLAMRKSNLIPNIFNAKLYLDNRRSPGYTRVEPAMAGNVFYGFVGEHLTGHYSKAHAHLSSAVLVCINGKGYTYTWPRTIGMTPWKDGKADQVYRQDYETVGLVTAAPYGGDWFHAHFGVSKEPLRLIGWYGPNNHRKDRAGVPGEKDIDEGAIDVTEGGTAIPYWLEDPFLRQEYEADAQAGRHGLADGPLALPAAEGRRGGVEADAFGGACRQRSGPAADIPRREPCCDQRRFVSSAGSWPRLLLLRAEARWRPLRRISPTATWDGCMTAAPRFRRSKARRPRWSRIRRTPSSARRRAGGLATPPIPI